MKPTITAINGDQGGVSAANMPQSVNLKGTGFTPDMVLIIKSVDHTNRSGPPVVQISAKGTKQGILIEDSGSMDATVNFPIDSNGPALALVFSASTGLASDWFSFIVK